MQQQTDTDSAHTVIEVTEVTPATDPLPEIPSRTAMESLLKPPSSLFPDEEIQDSGEQQGKQIEACSCGHEQLVAHVSFHPVVAAIHEAFHDHRPLVLSPDILWLLIAQGFAHHINNNAESLRPLFVKHSGKVPITVRRDDFIKGSPDNPWPEVFDEFTAQIRKHIGKETHDLLQPAFSTTGATEKAAAQVVLLDAMQSYFSYQCITFCGIPQIILEGTTDDWENLAKRVDTLAQFDLQWWTQRLAPIVEEIISASRGQVNPVFWRSIYKYEDESGGPYITGWITAFFPYPNSCSSRGLTTDSFPSGLACAPFSWQYFDRSYEMEFLGGFIGIRQEAETLRLKPEIGWAVRGEQPEQSNGFYSNFKRLIQRVICRAKR